MSAGLILGAALAAATGSVLPWVSGEVVVAGAALAVQPRHVPVLVGACAVAQMVGKLGIYAAARWAPGRLPARARALRARAERFRSHPRLLTASVLTGSMMALPPFYVVTLACGVLRLPVARFAVAGLCGTLARYAAIAWIALLLTTG